MHASNLPICVGQMGLGMFGFGPGMEQFENQHAQIMLDMAKTVEVDSEKHTVFIGMTENEEKIGLLEYEADLNSVTNQEFFRRWDETHIMILEFVVFSMSIDQLSGAPSKHDIRWVVRGLWQNGKWNEIGIFAHTMFPIGGA